MLASGSQRVRPRRASGYTTLREYGATGRMLEGTSMVGRARPRGLITSRNWPRRPTTMREST